MEVPWINWNDSNNEEVVDPIYSVAAVSEDSFAGLALEYVHDSVDVVDDGHLSLWVMSVAHSFLFRDSVI